MRLHRFYIAEKIGNNTEMKIKSVELSNQIRKVFRLKLGDHVVLFDGSGFDYESSVEDYGNDFVTVKVLGAKQSRFMAGRDSANEAREVVLCAGVVKKDTFEWIVEKATELGVSKIIPVMAERSEKKSLNMDRLRKIAVEASEQSGRGDVPEIGDIATLAEAVELCEKVDVTSCDIVKLAFHTDGETYSTAKIRSNTNNKLAGKSETMKLVIFIGPEGGWSPDEIEMFHKHNIDIYSLGNQVLRSETAVVVALSLVMLGK